MERRKNRRDHHPQHQRNCNVAVATLILDRASIMGPDPKADPTAVKLASVTPITLAKSTTVPVGVSIGGLIRPGIYRGSFEIRVPQDAPGSGTEVRFEVTLVGRPVLVVGPSTLSGLNCWLTSSCTAASFITTTNTTLGVENRGSGVATVKSRTMVLRAARGGQVFTDSQGITLDPLELIPVGATAKMNVRLGDSTPAGRYQGFVRIATNENDDAFVSDVAFDVRDSPWLAIALLFFGILIGRGLQVMNSPSAQAKRDLTERLRELAVAASQVRDSSVSLFLDHRIRGAAADIETMIASTATLGMDLDEIASLITVAKRLDAIRLESVQAGPKALPTITQHLDQARQALFDEDLKAADTEAKTARALIFVGTPPADLPRIFEFAARPKFGVRPGQSVPQAPPRGLRFVRTLAGTESDPRIGWYAYLKPVLSLLLLIALVMVGLYGMYFKNTVFGADWLYDYFGLLVWGVSADVAQRTLQTLPFSAK